MNPWLLYWVMKCDDIRAVFEYTYQVSFVVAFAGFVVLLVVGAIMGGDENTEPAPKKDWIKWGKLWLIVIGICAFAGITCVGRMLVPTTKQMAAIIVVPPMVDAVKKSETLNKLPGKLLTLADDWITELSPNKENADAQTNKKAD